MCERKEENEWKILTWASRAVQSQVLLVFKERKPLMIL